MSLYQYISSYLDYEESVIMTGTYEECIKHLENVIESECYHHSEDREYIMDATRIVLI